MECPEKCRNNAHERCCRLRCTCCRLVCRFDGCVSDGGCDFIVAVHADGFMAVELKSGRLGRDDAEDAVAQLKACMGFLRERGINVFHAVIYYGKRVDSAARSYVQREARRTLGTTPLLARCGDDICGRA